MKKLILAAVATIGFAGVSIAQEAPILYGDVSPSVENSVQNNEVNNGDATPLPDLGVDNLPTNSVEPEKSDGKVTIEDATNPSANDNIQGK